MGINPFMYNDALFAALGVIKTIAGLSYKNLEGLCKEALGDANAPDLHYPCKDY